MSDPTPPLHVYELLKIVPEYGWLWWAFSAVDDQLD